MLIKYVLQIGSDRYELQEDDLQNWSEVECTYKRSDFGGVMRSFTSKFEFVNKAYRLLMAEFDSKGFCAKAILHLYTIDNNWVYNLESSFELDFSTLSYTEFVLTMNAIDSSIESIIKANKSTKYEFVVGEGIPAKNEQYIFDRLIMIETATYEITDGESNDDGSITGLYTTDKQNRLYVGMINSELAVGNSLILNDDQTDDADGFLFSSIKNNEITLDYSITVGLEKGSAALILMKNDTPIAQLHKAVDGREPWLAVDQSSIESVMDYINSDPGRSHDWAYESWAGYWLTVQGIVWEVRTDHTLGTNMWVNTGKTRAEYVSITEADSISFNIQQGDKVWLKFDSDTNRNFKYMATTLTFSWIGKGSPIAIDCIDPGVLLECLLEKMGVGIDCEISSHTAVLQDTLILAAESIRGMNGAKIYASFNDFCNWMETVFGYIYVIDENNGLLEFKHRSEIFSSDADVVDILDAKDFNYSTNTSVLFSNVVIGYAKKDYDSVNGRDEFNFNSSYTTGYNKDGKKLELKSPFRADSYGIEFLAEKRNENTTDSSSDNDVFFVKGAYSEGVYHSSRTCNIQNSITGTLLNGEYSPIRCVLANAEYISQMAPSMLLTFASSDGNSDIIIDGMGMSDNLALEDCEMLTAGELKFTCGDLTMPEDANCLIRVKSSDFIYEGFIKQVSYTLARPEAVDYTILIKSKIPC